MLLSELIFGTNKDSWTRFSAILGLGTEDLQNLGILNKKFWNFVIFG